MQKKNLSRNFNFPENFQKNHEYNPSLERFYIIHNEPVEYFREPLYAGLVPTPFHRDTSRPATEAFFQAFPRLLHSIRRL